MSDPSTSAAAYVQQVLDEREKTRQSEDPDILPLTPDEIKAIGEIELGPSRHEQFLNAHYKKLMWGGIALGILGGSIIAYFSHLNDRKTEAAAQLVSAMKITAPGDAATPDAYDAKVLENLQQQHAGSAAAVTAKLMEGLSLLNAEDKSQGIARLQALAAECDDVLISARALAAVASSLQADGKTEESAKAWEQVAAQGQSPYLALAYLTLGDMARTSGQTEQARNYYLLAESKCATSTLVMNKTVQMHKMLLDVDAPTPVAPEKKAEETSDPLSTPADNNGGMEEYTPETSGHDSLHSILGTPGESWQTPGL